MLSAAYHTPPAHPDCSRREMRTNMFVIADLSSATATGTVRIRNMSSGGAMIEGAALPPLTARCRIARTDLELEGEIVWVAGKRAGIRFDGTAQVSQWLPNGGRTQADVDRAVQQVKAGIAAQTAMPPSSNRGIAPLISQPVDAAQAASVADQLEQLADALASDTDVVMRHMSRLQALDLAIQTLRKLADQH